MGEEKNVAPKKERGPRSKQKLKILYLVDILMRNTDANHDITLQEILDKLEANGVTAERKSLYDDIAQLSDYGIKVEKKQYGKTVHYKVINQMKDISAVDFMNRTLEKRHFALH